LKTHPLLGYSDAVALEPDGAPVKGAVLCHRGAWARKQQNV